MRFHIPDMRKNINLEKITSDDTRLYMIGYDDEYSLAFAAYDPRIGKWKIRIRKG